MTGSIPSGMREDVVHLSDGLRDPLERAQVLHLLHLLAGLEHGAQLHSRPGFLF